MLDRERRRFAKVTEQLEQALAKEVRRLETNHEPFLDRCPAWLLVVLIAAILIFLMVLSVLPFTITRSQMC